MNIKNTLFSLICLGFILSFNCTRDTSVLEPVQEINRAPTSLEKKLTRSDNQFGFKLFQQIAEEKKNDNFFISPLSVAYALGMAYNGANGETKAEMKAMLEFGDMTDTEINETFQNLTTLLMNQDLEVRFQIANSIWYRDSFTVEPDFINVNQTYFDAEVRSLDFNASSAITTINNWVEEKTNGKIDEIIDQIDPLTMMFLINAIYFNGDWTYQFDPELTQDDQFTKPDGSKIACRMMNQEAEFDYFETEDFQAIDLPYGNKKFKMAVFLPKTGKSIDALITDFTNDNWQQWIGMFNRTELTLQLPKFKLEYEIKLNDALKSLGMEVAFDDRADFTGIYKPGGLFISDVKHKTFVEVDEEGTEAAAVTVVEIRFTSIGDGIVMRVDRPFLFAIWDSHTGTILFMGKIVQPA